MIEIGILDDEDKVELLEGYVVLKTARNPPHDGTIQVVRKRLERRLPAGWDIRVQLAITLPDSVPEPDAAVVRGDEYAYLTRHPVATDVGVLVEVADSSLDRDRTDKLRMYARAGISHYWIVNLIDRCVEVHASPSAPTAAPAYGQRTVYHIGDSIPLTLDGVVVGSIPVQELLP